MSPERRRYWILRVGLVALTVVPLAVGLVLGDPIGGGPGAGR